MIAKLTSGQGTPWGPGGSIKNLRIAVADLGETDPQPGDKVLLAIRPEHFAIDAPAGDGINRLAATVTDKMFLGNMCSVFLTAEGGMHVVSRGTDRDAFERLATGSRVEIAWHRTSGRIVAP